MKKIQILLFVILCLSFPSSLFASYIEENNLLPNNWEDHHHTVIHAMGRIDGQDYTNSLEAFEQSYAKGFRVFEVDMGLSTDQKLVFLHDWNTFWGLSIGKGITGDPMSYEMYLKQTIMGKYTPLTGERLMDLLAVHKDAYIITDTKTIDPENFKLQLQLLVDAAKEKDITLLDQLVIQVYNEETAAALQEVYPFKNVIYTLYMSPDRNNIPNIMETLIKHNIRVLTIPSSLISTPLVEAMNSINVKIFTHTVNTITEVNKQKVQGISGFYTDYLLPYAIEHSSNPLLSQNITLKVNGKIVIPSVPPYLKNDTTLVPLRMITEELGIHLEYFQDTQTIVIPGPPSLVMTINDNFALLNGQAYSLPVAPSIIEGSTMVPIRFIAESFNLSVQWDEPTRTINLSNNTF